MKLCPLCTASAADDATACPAGHPYLVPDRRGQRVADRYELVALAGVGVQGTTVWEAERPGERVAVKVFEGTSPAQRERTLRKLASMPEIRNPLWIRPLGRGELGGRPFLVLPLLGGETLADQLGRGDEAAALEIAQALLSALAVAHAQGRHHGNLRPENVIRHEGQWRLMDPGLGWTPEDEARVDVVQYLAPEQLVVGGGSPASDVYQAAELIFALLVGRPLFPATTFTEQVRMKMTTLPDLSGVPARFRPALEKALAARPEDRPQDAPALAALLGIEARPLPAGRSSSTGWILAAVVLVAAAGLAYFFWPAPKPDPGPTAGGAASPRSQGVAAETAPALVAAPESQPAPASLPAPASQPAPASLPAPASVAAATEAAPASLAAPATRVDAPATLAAAEPPEPRARRRPRPRPSPAGPVGGGLLGEPVGGGRLGEPVGKRSEPLLDDPAPAGPPRRATELLDEVQPAAPATTRPVDLLD